MHKVYILNCDNAFFYVGITSNLNVRLSQHRNGQSLHTKRYSEFELVYCEEYAKRSDAEKREKQLKGWSRSKKKALISGNLELLIKLSQAKS